MTRTLNRGQWAPLLFALLAAIALSIPAAYGNCTGDPLTSGAQQPSAADLQLAGAVGFQVGAFTAATAKQVAVNEGDAEGCLVAASAEAGLNAAFEIWSQAVEGGGDLAGATLRVDARDCVDLGLAGVAVDPQVDAQVGAVVELVSRVVTSAAAARCSSSDDQVCAQLQVASAVLSATAEIYRSTVQALKDEGEHPDGIVEIALPGYSAEVDQPPALQLKRPTSTPPPPPQG